MIIARKLFIAALFCGWLTSLSALSVRPNDIANQAVFGITFASDSKAYYGKADAIHSISTQEYITSGFRVVELNIVTAGTGLLRIYHSRALGAGELQAAMMDGASAAGAPPILQRTAMPASIQSIADRASSIAEALTSDTVMKEYPIATHAGTIEYRVSSRSELLELFEQLKKHWLKEPIEVEGSSIVNEDGSTSQQMKRRTLGGTRFIVE